MGFSIPEQYERALDELHRERAHAELWGCELSVETESAYMAELDRLWWLMTNEEQQAYEEALEKAS